MKTVRNSQRVWPYCPSCDCRLEITDFSNTEYKMVHFGLHPQKDARGCRCKSLYGAWILPKHKLDYLGV